MKRSDDMVLGVAADGTEYEMPRDVAQDLEEGEDVTLMRDGKMVEVVSWKEKPGLAVEGCPGCAQFGICALHSLPASDPLRVREGAKATKKAAAMVASKKTKKAVAAKPKPKRPAAPKPVRRKDRHCLGCGQKLYGDDAEDRGTHCNRCEGLRSEYMQFSAAALLQGMSPNLDEAKARMVARSARLVADALYMESHAPFPDDEHDAGEAEASS